MDRSARMRDKKFDVPPEGEDWLWWRPYDLQYDEYLDADWNQLRIMTCGPCGVRWYQDTLALNYRCWNCGRFKRKPKI